MKVIIKTEKIDGTEYPVLYFPTEPVSNPNYIAYYSFYEGVHGEASKGYYYKNKPFKGSDSDARELLKTYDPENSLSLVRAYKQSAKDRDLATNLK